MTDTARSVQRTYLGLTLLNTLAASFIWGVNTLFLLDAGLNNAEAFTANAFFTVGEVVFEVPTGVVADTRGRRTSYLLGAGTLLLATLLYLVMWQLRAPLWGWAIASILLGLGFTFFSGATEAWLVDALEATGFEGSLEHVFGRAQVVGGAAMLVGSVLGGVLAQATTLAAPYIARAALLGLTLVVAWLFMHDLGFSPGSRRQPAHGGPHRPSRFDRRRLPKPTRALAHAGRPVHGRGRDLRLLRLPAVPAPALRRPERVRDRGPRGRARRRRPDRGWARRVAGPTAVPPAHRRPDPGQRPDHDPAGGSSA